MLGQWYMHYRWKHEARSTYYWAHIRGFRWYCRFLHECHMWRRSLISVIWGKSYAYTNILWQSLWKCEFSAIGEFLGQRRFHKAFEAINPDELDSKGLTSETRGLFLRDRHNSQILTCIFDAFGSLSEAEEEYFLGVTHLHMSLEEIHEWCK